MHMLVLRRNYLESGNHDSFIINGMPYNNSSIFTYNDMMFVMAQCHSACDSTSPLILDLVYLGLRKIP